MKVKEESEKSWFNTQHSNNEDHGIWSYHFMANRWGNNGSRETLFLDSEITVDGDCSHEIKRHLLLGRKAMTNLDSVLKSRDIILPTKVRLVKAMVFPVIMYGCDSWTIKKVESQRIDGYWTVVLEKTLESFGLQGESTSQSSRKSSPKYSLEGLMLKLKLQYSGNLMCRTDSLERTLMLGKIEGRRRRERQRMRRLDGPTDSMDTSLASSGSWWWTGKLGVLQSMGSQRTRQHWVTELNWKLLSSKTIISNNLNKKESKHFKVVKDDPSPKAKLQLLWTITCKTQDTLGVSKQLFLFYRCRVETQD